MFVKHKSCDTLDTAVEYRRLLVTNSTALLVETVMEMETVEHCWCLHSFYSNHSFGIVTVGRPNSWRGKIT